MAGDETLADLMPALEKKRGSRTRSGDRRQDRWRNSQNITQTMSKRCIIIPALNEEKSIGPLIERIKSYADAEIVVIDDGSHDCTAQIAAEAGALIIRHPFNMGYGVALQTGYKCAANEGCDYILQMDGDGQHNPKFIQDFFQTMESEECDVIIGSRFLGDNKYKAGVLKSAGIMLFRFITRIATGAKITDPTSGYQCLSRKVFTVFTTDSFPNDYPDANIIVMLHRLGFKIKEITVTMSENSEGRSMHKGIVTVLYYIFKMFLSIFISLLRGRSFYFSEARKK